MVHQDKNSTELTQVKHMRDRFLPIPYRHNAEDGTAFEKVVKRLLEQRARAGAESDDNRIHRIVANAVSLVEGASLPVETELFEAAEALHQPGQTQLNSPQVLFHRSEPVRLNAERAAVERRLAAWFYLKNRIRVQELDKSDPRRRLYQKVGRDAADGLYGLGGEQDVELAIQIEEQLGP
jgi:hypothetical protein